MISRVNGELWDLDRPLEADCSLEVLRFDSPDAQAVSVGSWEWAPHNRRVDKGLGVIPGEREREREGGRGREREGERERERGREGERERERGRERAYNTCG